MQLKDYQKSTLAALDTFFARALAEGPETAFNKAVKDQDDLARLEGRKPEARAYKPLQELPNTPYVCLRLPTGGGKTLLAAETIRIVARSYMRRTYPLTLWFVPSDAIKTQTLEALKNRTHAYRRRLDENFGGHVRVFDISEFEMLRPQDLERSACVVVSTIQSFRVKDTGNRKVYDHHEELEPHFSGIPTEGMETVSAEEAADNDMLREGAVKFSFANLLYHQRALMIVDEAHNAVSGLTREVQARIRPAAIVEFTATPRGRNNILYSVTASALKNEEMIKLPIRVRPHDDWRDAVSGAVATRHMLEEKAAKDRDHIRPVALYQAQAKNGHPTVAEVKRYLIEEKLIPENRIKIATGEQRELDGVDLRNPAEQTRHVITVQALKEGWDCPSAYVLCATQRLSSRTAVEQLLGRVLRMPFAARRKDAALNCAYAHVSEPSFRDAAEGLRDKLIDMGFTDEEVRESLKPRGVEQNDQGELFDPDPVRPRPVMQFSVPDTPEAREQLNAMQDEGVDYIPKDDGSLVVGVKGEITDEVASAVRHHTREADRSRFDAELEQHRLKVAQSRTLAQQGKVIEVPQLLVEMEGETFVAETDAIMERVDWSLAKHPAQLTETELSFHRNQDVIEIDLEGEKLVYSRTTEQQPPLKGLSAPSDADIEASLVQWLERECRVPDITQAEMLPWIAGVVADLLTRRDINIRTLIDWQHQIAARIRWKVGEIRQTERKNAQQMALFDEGAKPTWSETRLVRFDDSIYRNVPTQSTGAFRFRKHLLGADRAPLIDGDANGEEFQCAWALDSLEQVDVWVRNVARHEDSFFLPRVGRRFFPDFVARLNDGRLFVVEYKGEHLVGAPEAREKDMIGRVWAKTTGNVYLTVRKVSHGVDVPGQLQNALGLGSD
ncbi:DEAD/DEAH box helicase family protein [Phaeobacter inhibens]|uniref:DEAD/DEAH box helicase n=1 Tax=Phaeobacter inhibens TaxID=221822 RepID=UPI0021A46DE1|nr:DEAD/DEAH box helicase family protein [Phaeobacter inhibens]UWR92637.1 DEAD/DEAH box helicase family protein [Phaeobacter inhibens]